MAVMADKGRHQRVLDFFEQNTHLTVSELSHYLGVSDATVRRDLDDFKSTDGFSAPLVVLFRWSAQNRNLP
jgi:predicted ArsR family transcriptional regulator